MDLQPFLNFQKPIYTSQEELEQTLRTPQYRQAVDLFGHALQTGQLAPVLRQFGIDSNVATAAGSGSTYFNICADHLSVVSSLHNLFYISSFAVLSVWQIFLKNVVRVCGTSVWSHFKVFVLSAIVYFAGISSVLHLIFFIKMRSVKNMRNHKIVLDHCSS